MIWKYSTVYVPVFILRLTLQTIRRGLFRSPSDPSGSFWRSRSFGFGASPCLRDDNSPSLCSPMFNVNTKSRKSPRKSKRADDEEFTPLRVCKRRKSVVDVETIKEESPSRKHRIHRSHSEAEIKYAVTKASEQTNLIGDCSKVKAWSIVLKESYPFQ